MPQAMPCNPASTPSEFFTAWLYSHFYKRNSDKSITLKTQKSIEKDWAIFVKQSKIFNGNDYSYVMPTINWEDMKKINKELYDIAKSDDALPNPYYQLAINYGFIPIYE